MLERPSNAKVHGGALANDSAAVVAPRSADSDCERNRIAGDDVRRKLTAGRILDGVCVERPRPGMPGVDEHSRVKRVKEQRPGTDAALWARDRPAVVRVYERDVTAGKRVGREPAQQA